MTSDNPFRDRDEEHLPIPPPPDFRECRTIFSLRRVDKIAIRCGHADVGVHEPRAVEWLLCAVIGVCLISFGLWFCRTLWPPERLDTTLICILFGIPALVIWACYVPFNLQLALDKRDGVIEARRRFLFLCYQRRRFDLNKHWITKSWRTYTVPAEPSAMDQLVALPLGKLGVLYQLWRKSQTPDIQKVGYCVAVVDVNGKTATDVFMSSHETIVDSILEAMQAASPDRVVVAEQVGFVPMAEIVDAEMF